MHCPESKRRPFDTGNFARHIKMDHSSIYQKLKDSKPSDSTEGQIGAKR